MSAFIDYTPDAPSGPLPTYEPAQQCGSVVAGWSDQCRPEDLILAASGISASWVAYTVGAAILVAAGVLFLAAAMGGAVRTLVAWTAFVICVISITITIFTLRVDGVTVIGAVAFVAWVWGIGAMRGDWWSSDAPNLAAVDRELEEQGR